MTTSEKHQTMENSLIQPDYKIFIFYFRGRKVMLDTDLASFYGVSTKALKQQVKRNIARFPEDFMFELSEDEKLELMATNERLAGLKFSYVSPLVFSEQGVAMLSTVLRSEKAIHINIEIMRAFARYRAIIRENEELRLEIKQLEQRLNEGFTYLLARIDALHAEKKARTPIGFKQSQKP